MKKNSLRWGMLGVCAAGALVFAGLVLPPLSKEKSKTVRIKSTVNNIPVYQTPVTGTNAVSVNATKQ